VNCSLGKKTGEKTVSFNGGEFPVDVDGGERLVTSIHKAVVRHEETLSKSTKALSAAVLSGAVNRHSAEFRERFQWHVTVNGKWTALGIWRDNGEKMVMTAIGHHCTQIQSKYIIDFEVGGKAHHPPFLLAKRESKRKT
jgi:hypothetical protein